MPVKQTALKRNKSRRSRRNRRQSGGDLESCQEQSAYQFKNVVLGQINLRGQWQAADSSLKDMEEFTQLKDNLNAILDKYRTGELDKIPKQVDTLCNALKDDGNTELAKQLQDELLKFKECDKYKPPTKDVSYVGEDTPIKIGGGKSRRQSQSKKNQKKSRQSRRQSQSKKIKKKN